MMVRGMNKAHFGIMAAVFAVAGTTANAEVVLIDFGNDISFRARVSRAVWTATATHGTAFGAVRFTPIW